MGKPSTPNYGTDRKETARTETIISQYRNLFSRQSLPKEQQYYTLCAEHTDKDKLKEGSELEQLLRVGLIEPQQFVGIDQDPGIIERASRVLPSSRWIHGGFDHVLSQERSYNAAYRPGIVNCDTIYMAKKAGDLLGSVLFNTFHLSEVMVVANIIKRQRSKNHTIEELFEEVLKNNLCEYMIKSHFQYVEDCYVYSGSSNRHFQTHMCSIIFYRRKV